MKKDLCHGTDFEKKTVVNLALSLTNKKKDFEIATEIPGAGKFDDCIIKNRDQMIFVQIKHKADTNNTITNDDLLKKGGPLCLIDYFISSIEIEYTKEFDSDEKHFYFYTNNDIRLTNDPNKNLFNYLKEHKNEILKLNRGVIYKFDIEQLESIKLILGEEFKQIPKMFHLALALAKSFNEKLPIDENTPIFKLNQVLLKNYVLDLKFNKISTAFLASNNKVLVQFRCIFKICLKTILRNDGKTDKINLKDVVLNISNHFTTSTPSDEIPKFETNLDSIDHLSEFLKSFYFALKQPDGVVLGNLNLEELKKIKSWDNPIQIMSNFLVNFEARLLKSNEPITYKGLQESFNSAKIVDIAPNLIGLSKSNKMMLDKFEKEYITKDTNGDTLVQTIRDFMENDDAQNRIWNCQKSEDVRSITLKVFQVVRSIKNRDDCIFLRSQNIKWFFDDMSKALTLHKHTFIIELTEDMTEQMEILIKLNSVESKNKIVFIMEVTKPPYGAIPLSTCH
jgi:hypothetical protein